MYLQNILKEALEFHMNLWIEDLKDAPDIDQEMVPWEFAERVVAEVYAVFVGIDPLGDEFHDATAGEHTILSHCILCDGLKSAAAFAVDSIEILADKYGLEPDCFQLWQDGHYCLDTFNSLTDES